MYYLEDFEEIIYNTFIENGLAVDRELVEYIAEDIVNYMIEVGYITSVDE